SLITLGGGGAAYTTGLTVHSTSDVDWYKVVPRDWGGPSDSVLVRDFLDSQGDLDVQLYNSGGSVIDSSTSEGDFELIKLEGRAPGTYSLKVYGYSGAINYYSIVSSRGGAIAEDAGEPKGGDTQPTALPLQRQDSDKLKGTSGGTIHPGDVDWYRITLPAG